MANRTIKIFGNNYAADTALVVSFGGAEVYNGTISTSVTAHADVYGGTTTTPAELCEFTYSNADDTTETEHALSITCSTGSCSIGSIYDISNNDNTNYESYASDNKPQVIDIGGKWYYKDAGYGVYHDRSVEPTESRDNSGLNKKNILINGNAPTADANGAAILSGTQTFAGYSFDLDENDVLACTLRVAKILSPYDAG